MDIRSVRIQNYRAIEDVTVPLNYQINPIIGINESGKTTILKAILSLDKSRDRTNKGKHLEYQNKYITKDTKNCTITANVYLSEEELTELVKFCRFKTDSVEYQVVDKITHRTVLHFARKLSQNKEYTITNDGFPEALRKKLVKFIQGEFPVFLYFDDFTDRVPEEIRFPEEYKADGKLSKPSQREWQEIIEEILKRSELEGIEGEQKPLQSYFQIDDLDRKYDILSDIEDVLNDEIIEEWKKVKRRGKNNFADDSENLQIELDNRIPNRFQFKVRDSSNKNKKRTFNVNERSKGFQWFFNYMIKLKFNPRYKGKLENSIFLLDEPGSYLHSSAQSELLKELKSVSENNKIIYCTHSQFLLNPDDIKLGSIKIAQKKDAKVTLHLFGQFDGERNSGALSPIYQALNLNFAHNFVGNIIITEGITDYYVLRMTQKHWNFPLKDTVIIPGSGSGSSSNLISFALGLAKDFRIVFDNDKAGLQAVKKYKKEFGDEIQRYCHIYYPDENNFKLEKHFSKADQDRMKNITGASTVKKAIPLLYLDHPKKVKGFLDSMDATSKERLGVTINTIGI